MAKAAKYIVALGLALACVSALAGAVAARRYGPTAYEASAVAALINWVAGSMALGTVFLCRSQFCSNPGLRANSVLLAMVVRMALPLVALAWLTRTQHPLAQAGLGGLIVVHYLAGLALETMMSVRLVASLPQDPRPTHTSSSSPATNPSRLAVEVER